MTNEMHSSYNQFLFHSFLSALHVSNESSHSSSGARHNILCYTVWCNRADKSSCFEVVGKSLTHKKLWNKMDYKNCASHWSLTHCNMMHGTHK